MSINWASLTLLVVLGATVATCSPINSVSTVLAQAHKSIADHLKLTQPVVGSNPLFSSVLRSINNSCQVEVMLMNATLDVYMRIFSSLLKHRHHSHHEKSLMDQVPTEYHAEVWGSLKKLEDIMDKLKTHLSHLQQNKEDLLGKLNAIKVDDPLVQRKALAEFLEVYHTASDLLPRDSAQSH